MTKRWHETWTPGENTRYRKQVREVEAFRYCYETEPDWWVELLKTKVVEIDNSDKVTVHGITGDMRLWPGDWVIRTVKTTSGREDVYVCHHDQFIELFEPAEKYTKAA